SINLNWRRHDDEFRLWRDTTHRSVNKHTSYVYSFDANIYEQWKGGTSSFGVDIRNEQIRSSVLDTHQRNIAGLYAEHRFPKHKIFSGVIGTNVSYIEGYGWVAYPGAEAGIRPFESLRFSLSIGRSYRVPTFTDLYYTDGGPTSLGNPNLYPEEAWTYEGSLLFERKGLRAQLTYFQRNASSLIDWQKQAPTDPTWMAVNVLGNTTQGLELNLHYQTSWKWLPLLRLDYTYLDGTTLPGTEVSRYVYDFLKHQIIASVNLNYGKGFGQRIQYRYMERVGYPTAHVVDTRLFYQSRKWGAYAQLENASGTEYFYLRNVPMPKSWMRLGLQVHLK
ncbi:MAG: TonB-dependent receptor, partial [Bacteroidota bacterium]|nr:TonB-dependent receptor [Bacteroidota bacterium]MDX5431686.1 TonB-dependent receptor [Bacteroidota bacterium]MDX5470401.1 TonB-dependent receptor [Bacteroidota bacterium]